MSDGEVGGRKLWISWQYALLRASSFLPSDPSGKIRPTNRFPLLTLAEGIAPTEIHFGEAVIVAIGAIPDLWD